MEKELGHQLRGAEPPDLVADHDRDRLFDQTLFRQERVGYRGKSFQILKFRTMKADAETLCLGQKRKLFLKGR